MRISGWSSDVCSSDLIDPVTPLHVDELVERGLVAQHRVDALDAHQLARLVVLQAPQALVEVGRRVVAEADEGGPGKAAAAIDAGVCIGIRPARILRADGDGDTTTMGQVTWGTSQRQAAPAK